MKRLWAGFVSGDGTYEVVMGTSIGFFGAVLTGVAFMQREWGEALLAAGADYAVWRPKDWGLIEATLKGEGE